MNDLYLLDVETNYCSITGLTFQFRGDDISALFLLETGAQVLQLETHLHSYWPTLKYIVHTAHSVCE